ncbi:MAG TPA: DUF6504 family protein [Streptosporangiaceae bacterium]|nr:DUF6504 family protein [Streptosporangiaceae bacterium]
MSGVRSEPVDVWVVDGRPARFVWRERLYTVLAILERPPAQPAAHDQDAREENDPEGAQRTWRWWKVTASSGRNVPANIYLLCQDPSTGRWQLTRNGR